MPTCDTEHNVDPPKFVTNSLCSGLIHGLVRSDVGNERDFIRVFRDDILEWRGEGPGRRKYIDVGLLDELLDKRQT